MPPFGREIVKQTVLSGPPRDNSLAVALIGVLGILVVSLLCWRGDRHVYQLLSAIPANVLDNGEYWRLLTALFVHANLQHYLSNAVLFGLFSYLLFGYYGFWVYPALSTLLGILVNCLALISYHPADIALVGASGLVYVMGTFWLTMYVFVERRLSLNRRLLHGIGLALIILMPSAFDPSVSYRSHFLGFVVGFLAALIYFGVQKSQLREAEIVEIEEEEATTHLGSLDIYP